MLLKLIHNNEKVIGGGGDKFTPSTHPRADRKSKVKYRADMNKPYKKIILIYYSERIFYYFIVYTT